ncbi:hypothetical protein BO226_25165 (plasmid) [Rhodococcus sp. 2G]|nr:hypothetical protein BO226_25165 [Rhodococcus sp. 2G]
MSAIALGNSGRRWDRAVSPPGAGIRDRDEFDACSAGAQPPFVYTSQWAIAKVYSQRAADVVATAVATAVTTGVAIGVLDWLLSRWGAVRRGVRLCRTRGGLLTSSTGPHIGLRHEEDPR